MNSFPSIQENLNDDVCLGFLQLPKALCQSQKSKLYLFFKQSHGLSRPFKFYILLINKIEETNIHGDKSSRQITKGKDKYIYNKKVNKNVKSSNVTYKKQNLKQFSNKERNKNQQDEIEFTWDIS